VHTIHVDLKLSPSILSRFLGAHYLAALISGAFYFRRTPSMVMLIRQQAPLIRIFNISEVFHVSFTFFIVL